MAEFALFSLASKLLITIATPAFKKAYKKARSIRNAGDELEKLRRTIETIQAVLLDAEKKQLSTGVQDWIKRVGDVLYDADDLFDDISTDYLLEQQIKGNKILKKVRVSCSKLNPLVSSNSIANKVKRIRKSLLEIFTDMALFDFVRNQFEEPISDMRLEQDPGSFVDPKDVFGRDEDKKSILKALLDKSSNPSGNVSTIAIVGIGGMGKTTLAQLVYNDEEVKGGFEKRWFVCISDTTNEKKVIGKIFQSINGTSYADLTLDQLQSKIGDAIKNIKNFLLVLDDVWDKDHGRWQNRLSLLSSGAKGSKIVVTTRSLDVARALDAVAIHNLDGLSENDSWALFQRVAFTPEQRNDPEWTNLGREIMKKCANVPLAIKSIGSLLYTKTTMQEWEYISEEELLKLGQSGQNPIMPVLKLSYNHLHSSLKQCVAYCSLFPKGYLFSKHVLIYLWIAQGYVKPNNEKQTVEDAGHSYFMDLLRRCFFHVESTHGDALRCKMHDLIHNLIRHVAGEESVMLTSTSPSEVIYARHVSVGSDYFDYSRDIGAISSPSTIKRLRSFMLLDDSNGVLYARELSVAVQKLSFPQQFPNFKCLRVLSLRSLLLQQVPSSIGELKHLRYLDISRNYLEKLPGSITKLLNLCTLNMSECVRLLALPDDFGKLVNLRHLSIRDCGRLKHMPPGFGVFKSLQHLDEFKVSKGQTSQLDALGGLKLRGELYIRFEDETDDWDGVEFWQVPVTLQELSITGYNGTRIPKWGNDLLMLPKLTHLSLIYCSRVKCLPPFRHLPNLKRIHLFTMDELEYIEDEVEAASNTLLFLPNLVILRLEGLLKLKGWSRKTETTTRSQEELLSFPCLTRLYIGGCPKLVSMPSAPLLDNLALNSANAKVIPQLLPVLDHSTMYTSSSSSLQVLDILGCEGLTSFPGESLTSLRCLSIQYCDKLKQVKLPPAELNILDCLSILDCQELELWEEEKRGVDWDSLPNLIELYVDEIPSPTRLPKCIQDRQALGKLIIVDEDDAITEMRYKRMPDFTQKGGRDD